MVTESSHSFQRYFTFWDIIHVVILILLRQRFYYLLGIFPWLSKHWFGSVLKKKKLLDYFVLLEFLWMVFWVTDCWEIWHQVINTRQICITTIIFLKYSISGYQVNSVAMNLFYCKNALWVFLFQFIYIYSTSYSTNTVQHRQHVCCHQSEVIMIFFSLSSFPISLVLFTGRATLNSFLMDLKLPHLWAIGSAYLTSKSKLLLWNRGIGFEFFLTVLLVLTLYYTCMSSKIMIVHWNPSEDLSKNKTTTILKEMWSLIYDY